eukprot:scaffold1913_cov60-Phaeocystis_antarctica.AAC.2
MRRGWGDRCRAGWVSLWVAGAPDAAAGPFAKAGSEPDGVLCAWRALLARPLACLPRGWAAQLRASALLVRLAAQGLAWRATAAIAGCLGPTEGTRTAAAWLVLTSSGVAVLAHCRARRAAFGRARREAPRGLGRSGGAEQ